MVSVATEVRHPRFDERTSALLLDIDGTLLDIAPTPDSVSVPAELVRAIDTIYKRNSGAVAFVSGRQIEAMDRLFAPLILPAIGCHGGEIRAETKGGVQRQALLPDSVRQRISDIVMKTQGVRVEDKGLSLALHFRSAPEAGPELRRALEGERALLASADLTLLGGKSVIEIKPNWFNKGTGVADLLRHKPFSTRTPIFIGDDETDEDVIHLLRELGGTGYGVGRELPGTVFTFESPSHVRSWLGTLARG